MNKLAQFYGGIDLHKTVTQICILDMDSEVIEENRFRADDLRTGLEVIQYLSRGEEFSTTKLLNT